MGLDNIAITNYFSNTMHYFTNLLCIFSLEVFNVYIYARPSTNIIEGTHVTLTCSERSNAVVYQYEWLKGRHVVGNSSTLTLASIQREDSGFYYCRVSATIPNTTRTINWASSLYLYVKCKFLLLHDLFKLQFLRKRQNFMEKILD